MGADYTSTPKRSQPPPTPQAISKTAFPSASPRHREINVIRNSPSLAATTSRCRVISALLCWTLPPHSTNPRPGFLNRVTALVLCPLRVLLSGSHIHERPTYIRRRLPVQNKANSSTQPTSLALPSAVDHDGPAIIARRSSGTHGTHHQISLLKSRGLHWSVGFVGSTQPSTQHTASYQHSRDPFAFVFVAQLNLDSWRVA